MSSGGKKDGLDKEIHVIVLADTPGAAEITLNHVSVPYPRNLTLVIWKKYCCWLGASTCAGCVDIQCGFYSQTVSSETQAVIKDLDFEKSDLPNSPSKCNIKRKLLLEAILVGRDFQIAPECFGSIILFQLRSLGCQAAIIDMLCTLMKGTFHGAEAYCSVFQSLQPNP